MLRRFLIISFLASSAAAAPMNCMKLRGLKVDADGAPNSYRVDDRGLSPICVGAFAIVNGVPQTQHNNPRHFCHLSSAAWAEAVRSGDYSHVKIVGFMKDGLGRPVTQGAGDPLPNDAYVTITALGVQDAPVGLQRKYVNALEIPYAVLSSDYAHRYALSKGDLVALYRPTNQHLAFAVFGDCCRIGEASVRAHQDLGNDPMVTEGGTGIVRAKKSIDDPVWIVGLTGAHTRATVNSSVWRQQIKHRGEAAFFALGGLDALKACILRG